MAKHKPDSASQTLEQLESASDRFAHWVVENARLVLGSAAGILVIAGAYGFVRSSGEDAQMEASADLAAVQRGYREAMGAGPNDLTVPEPANPETARQVRARFVEEYEQVAADHAGTTSAALAALGAGDLQLALGERDEAIATWQAGLEAAEGAVYAFLQLRIAGAHEDAGRWAEAGSAYEAAAVADFPLRYQALADAARCLARAGEDARAIALFERIESEAPEMQLAPHVDSGLRELRARAGG